MTVRLRVGMDAGYYLEAIIKRTADFDPSAIVSAAFVVTRKGSAPASPAVTWSTTIQAQSSLAITLRHTFNADGTDLDVAGMWEFHARCATAVDGVTKETDPRTFEVDT